MGVAVEDEPITVNAAWVSMVVSNHNPTVVVVDDLITKHSTVQLFVFVLNAEVAIFVGLLSVPVANGDAACEMNTSA